MSHPRLTEAERDEAYTRICLAISEAGERRESLFLARLCLLLAEEVGDAGSIGAAIAAAKLDQD